MAHKPLGDGGKGPSRRTEDRAAVEANWPTNWNAREALPDMPCDQGGDTEKAEEA